MASLSNTEISVT